MFRNFGLPKFSSSHRTGHNGLFQCWAIIRNTARSGVVIMTILTVQKHGSQKFQDPILVCKHGSQKNQLTGPIKKSPVHCRFFHENLEQIFFK
jgi:hypothetical protein